MGWHSRAEEEEQRLKIATTPTPKMKPWYEVLAT